MNWLFSRALVEAFSGDGSLGGIPSALSSSTPSVEAYWWLGRTTDLSLLSRFGMTSAHSTACRGGDLLTWCLGASRARTSVTPAGGRGSTASNPDSGGKWPESSERSNPAMPSSKIRLALQDGALIECSGTLPRWGSMRNGVCWGVPTLARRMSAPASGLWPTLAAQTKRGGPKGLDGGSRARAALRKLVDEDTAKGMCCGRLNRRWAEWFMGWPATWTDFAPLATDRFREWQQQHGDC